MREDGNWSSSIVRGPSHSISNLTYQTSNAFDLMLTALNSFLGRSKNADVDHVITHDDTHVIAGLRHQAA